MPLSPTDWNVVVPGNWNRAILTPAGIARRLFRLAADVPVEVHVPLDAVGPYQVKHEGIVVVPSNARLVVQAADGNFEQLDRAKEIAAIAINALPETPVTAAGINVRYTTDQPVGSLQPLTEHPSDLRLSDAGYTITSRAVNRTVNWNTGVINVSIQKQADDSFSILLNFTLASSDIQELTAWLRRPTTDVVEATRQILRQYFEISETEVADATRYP